MSRSSHRISACRSEDVVVTWLGAVLAAMIVCNIEFMCETIVEVLEALDWIWWGLVLVPISASSSTSAMSATIIVVAVVIVVMALVVVGWGLVGWCLHGRHHGTRVDSHDELLLDGIHLLLQLVHLVGMLGL